MQTLSRLFKFEFMFRADATFEQNFAETLADMMATGELATTATGEILRRTRARRARWRRWIAFYASVVRNFLESYRIAARGLLAACAGP